MEALPDLIAQAGRTPRAIYTIPNFQNPSGVTLSQRRREQLLDLAARWGSAIIDDDPHGLLRFEGSPIPAFSQLDPGNPQIFSVRTFSKIVASGLRIGWVDADPSLQPLLINAKQAMDTCTSVPTQRTVTDFLAREHLQPSVRGLYRERKDAMRGALARHFGDTVRATDPRADSSCGSPSPTGGSTPRRCSKPHWPKASPTFPAPLSPPAATSTTHSAVLRHFHA